MAQVNKGFCVWFTGLPCSGKTTTAKQLVEAIPIRFNRKVSLFDGDDMRQTLCRGLGFSAEDRHENVMRVGYVASQVVFHDGIAVCSLVSPNAASRLVVREVIRMVGGQFIEVWMHTPLDLCIARDVKGMYAKAKAGEITNFTGVQEHYEISPIVEFGMNTDILSVNDNVCNLIDYLNGRGLL